MHNTAVRCVGATIHNDIYNDKFKSGSSFRVYKLKLMYIILLYIIIRCRLSTIIF
jgi:hypothetical protein